jgi:hemin uptake protein HemP
VPAKALPRVPVETLLAGGREVILLHGDTEYHLRLTSNGKLILTK